MKMPVSSLLYLILPILLFSCPSQVEAFVNAVNADAVKGVPLEMLLGKLVQGFRRYLRFCTLSPAKKRGGG